MNALRQSQNQGHSPAAQLAGYGRAKPIREANTGGKAEAQQLHDF